MSHCLLPWSRCVTLSTALITLCHTVYCPGHVVSHCLLPWSRCVTLSTALVTLCHTVYCPGHVVSHCLLPWSRCVTLSTAHANVSHLASLPSAVPNQSVFARACSCYQFLAPACSCYQFLAPACSCYQFVAPACSCKPMCCTQLPFSVNGSHTCVVSVTKPFSDKQQSAALKTDLPLQTNQSSATRQIKKCSLIFSSENTRP